MFNSPHAPKRRITSPALFEFSRARFFIINEEPPIKLRNRESVLVHNVADEHWRGSYHRRLSVNTSKILSITAADILRNEVKRKSAGNETHPQSNYDALFKRIHSEDTPVNRNVHIRERKPIPLNNCHKLIRSNNK